MKSDAAVMLWKKRNPWILQNVQNGDSLCGRFPTLESAKAEAERRGGVVEIRGRIVLFSEMPNF